jgi:hypothetical protein
MSRTTLARLVARTRLPGTVVLGKGERLSRPGIALGEVAVAVLPPPSLAM